MIRRRALPLLLVSLAFGSSGLAGCDFKGAVSAQLTPIDKQTASADPTKVTADVFKFFVRGKKTSNLSEDRKTITLSIDAEDPQGGNLSVTWGQQGSFGSFNTDRGKDVQWTVTREGTFVVELTATVQSSSKPGEADVARFYLPIENGKIKATELAPEITVAPQSLVLFRPLPASLAMSADALAAVGVKTQAQLVATTYIYDSATNTKVKRTGNVEETKWTSGDPAIVTVDDNGLVKPADGSEIGRAVVTASSKTNSASTAGSQVTVQYLDTSITLSYPTSTIYLKNQGTPDNVTIGATVEYSNPTDRNRVVFTDPNGREITWKSSNPSIAQVDATGKVTPLADAATGDVTISAISKYDPSKNASVVIHVLGNVASNVNVSAH